MALIWRRAQADDTPAVLWKPSPIIVWNQALTASIAAAAHPPTVAVRAISMVHEAVYNTWAAYGSIAAFTLPGLQYRPAGERTRDNKAIAASHAAYGVLVDLYPARKADFETTPAQTLAGLPVGRQQGGVGHSARHGRCRRAGAGQAWGRQQPTWRSGPPAPTPTGPATCP